MSITETHSMAKINKLLQKERQLIKSPNFDQIKPRLYIYYKVHDLNSF